MSARIQSTRAKFQDFPQSCAAHSAALSLSQAADTSSSERRPPLLLPGQCCLPPGLGAHRASCRWHLCQPSPRASTEVCSVTLPFPGCFLLLGTERHRGTSIWPRRRCTVAVHLNYSTAHLFMYAAHVCRSPNIVS